MRFSDEKEGNLCRSQLQLSLSIRAPMRPNGLARFQGGAICILNVTMDVILDSSPLFYNWQPISLERFDRARPIILGAFRAIKRIKRTLPLAIGSLKHRQAGWLAGLQVKWAKLQLAYFSYATQTISISLSLSLRR